MPDSPRKDISESEIRRLRDVLVLYGAAFRNIPVLNTPDPSSGTFVPRPSPDSILVTLCQLTAIRLGAQRAMISLIDDKRQYILAEATCDQSLRPHRLESSRSALWLGNVNIPRNSGLCEKVLDLGPENTILIIKDLRKFHEDTRRIDIQSAPDMRFYASTALLSPRGASVGTICIYDDQEREGLSETETSLLRDFSSTIIEYLNTYALEEKYRRGERFTRGLVSFSKGASALVSFRDQDQLESTEGPEFSLTDFGRVTRTDSWMGTEATTDYDAVLNSEVMVSPDHTEVKSSTVNPSTAALNLKSGPIRSARHKPIRKSQESNLPDNSRLMFSRAANILMAASDLDGVLILDASVAANEQRQSSPAGSSTENAPESYQSKLSSSEGETWGIEGMQSRVSSSTAKLCRVLGVATQDRYADYPALLEPDLGQLLQDFPDGMIFNFIAEGFLLPSEDSVSPNGSTGSLNEDKPKPTLPMKKERRRSIRACRSSVILRALFPGVRSVSFIPFWDYERSRWFAGCLCWTNDSYRLLSISVDLPHFKVFGHSIMRELSKLDAVALYQTKTTFVASLSHELRSPLHGILGTLEFMKGTDLDSFQVSMLNSLNGCGQTLLDTINHLMDHAKTNESKRSVTVRRMINENTIRLSSRLLKGGRKKHGAFDLGAATEEVVEAVLSGRTYVPVTANLMGDSKMPVNKTSNHSTERKQCLVILDLEFEQDWIYCFPVGFWKRIVMNLFGNAIKNTTSGLIDVSLRAKKTEKKGISPVETTVTLTITDSGCGISSDFLVNRAFHPFAQENVHSAGTGLGLSLVQQIIETTGGKIEMSSSSAGTKVSVKLSLARPDTPLATFLGPREEFMSNLPRLEGRRICILHKENAPSSKSLSTIRTEEALVHFTNDLVKTLKTHLKVDVIRTTKWQGHNTDIVIVPEISFEYLYAIRQRRMGNDRAPVTIFIAVDALEAFTLRSDARVLNRESVVEIMTQPCGPYKLAYILNRCLDRFARPEENIRHAHSNSTSPGDWISTPKVLPQNSPTLDAPKNSLNPVTDPNFSPISSNPFKLTQGPSTMSPTSGSLGASLERKKSTMLYLLFADDNMVNRKLLAAFLEKQDICYAEASDGLEALNAYKNGAPEFDVILMDLSMPVMDGMASTRAIREYEHDRQLSRCCIIALTGLTSPSAKSEAWSSGIDHFLTKPVNFKSLAEILRKEMEKRKGSQQDLKQRKKARGVAFSDDAKRPSCLEG